MCDNSYINIQNEYHMEQHRELDTIEYYSIDDLLDAVVEAKELHVEVDSLYKKILSAYEEVHETYVNLIYKKPNG